jgi:hypothetical protein
VWMIMAIWSGMMNLAILAVNWWGRAFCERVHAASVVMITQAIRTGGIVHDERQDGTRLHIEVPASRLPAVPERRLHPTAAGDGDADSR